MSVVEFGPIRAIFMLDLSTAHLPEETLREITQGEFYPKPIFVSDDGFISYIGERPSGEAEQGPIGRFLRRTTLMENEG